MRRALAVSITFAMALLALGCGGGSSSPTEPASRDSLVLLGVEPAQGARVTVGKRVPVRARFQYAFQEAAGGKIGVLVYPLPPNLPILTDPIPVQAVLEARDGEAALAFDLVLDDPELRPPSTVVMSFALFPQGQAVSTALVEVRYPVAFPSQGSTAPRATSSPAPSASRAARPRRRAEGAAPLPAQK